MYAYPQRKHPAHPSPVERHNEPIVLFVTLWVKDASISLAADAVHVALREAWSRASEWHVCSYLIMPDHIHLFCVPGVLQPVGIKWWNKFWKGQFRRIMNLDRTVWQQDGWDTQMRDYAHYVEKRAYVRQNPVRKGLVANSEEWPFMGELRPIRW